jgi:phenylalanyl-tRNA synthetase beta subunit
VRRPAASPTSPTQLTPYHTDPTYFPGRAATIYYRAPGASATTGVLGAVRSALSRSTFHDRAIGTLGVLHPSVLEKFEIGYATEGPAALGKPAH